jgi:competence protein ComEA
VPADLVSRLRALDVTASGRALLSLAAVCGVLLLVTAWALLRSHGTAPPPAAAPLPMAALPSPTPSGLVVDVGGRVRRPGLVTLPPGSRVADAVRAAGGALRRRDLATINLAAKVSDGQLLLIGMPGGDASGAGAVGGTAGPVSLNSASVDQLDELPGIGPVLPQRIVDWRTQHGGFKSVRDLDQVSGIGDTIYAELEPLVTV